MNSSTDPPDQAGPKNADHPNLDAQVYDELRRLAASYLNYERPGHTLRPTGLVHEAYLKLAGQNAEIAGRTHFFALAAQAMRRILVDHARTRNRVKRGGGLNRISFDDALVVNLENEGDLLAVDEALSRLAELDPRQAQIVEMRFFGGMTVEEVAEALGLSRRTVEREWTMARAWLRQQLSEDDQSDS
ncbi:MAG: sigma-70 family RNA polymerase sigma factor [Pirellulaceae bacterium]